MDTIYVTLRFIHILAMAVWFASGLTVASDARRSLAAGDASIGPLKDRLKRAYVLNAIASVVTVGSGLALFFRLGGFKVMPPRYHASLGLALLSLALLFALIGPAMQQVTGDDKEGRASALKKLGMFTGIDHLLKLIILFLMVFPFR
jgi:hypothetical protein